jgi:hypothetical protein
MDQRVQDRNIYRKALLGNTKIGSCLKIDILGRGPKNLKIDDWQICHRGGRILSFLPLIPSKDDFQGVQEPTESCRSCPLMK